jgi:hypothetical protein
MPLPAAAAPPAAGGRRRAEDPADQVAQPQLRNWRPDNQPSQWPAPVNDPLDSGLDMGPERGLDDALNGIADQPTAPPSPPARHEFQSTGAHSTESGRRASQHGGEERPGGAHAAGTSVTELLATHGSANESRRHRRRDG